MTATPVRPARPVLLTQYEHDQPDAQGVFYGFTVYRVPTGFTARFHSRTYDGVRVASSWSSDPVQLRARDRRSAVVAATAQFRAWLDR